MITFKKLLLYSPALLFFLMAGGVFAFFAMEFISQSKEPLASVIIYVWIFDKLFSTPDKKPTTPKPKGEGG